MPVTIDGFDPNLLAPTTLRLPLSDAQSRVLWWFVEEGGRATRKRMADYDDDRREAHGYGGDRIFRPFFHNGTVTALSDRGLLRWWTTYQYEFDDRRWKWREERVRSGYEITPAGEDAIRA